MSRSMRLMVLVGLLAMASAPLAGCGGAECGPGTKESGDQCVAAGELVTDEVCSEGTVLVNGSCVLDESGCGENTQLNAESGVCEQVPGYCGEGTSWDSGAEQCVPNTDITCGEGTQAQDGTCVPALDEICGDKTAADGQGRCVIQADACATGEVLDPNTGSCVSTDTYCSANTAFDADSATCVPTADVCDTGTKFDADSGLCLPDACQMGDVLLNGVCVSPAEELAANADLTEAENNDPALGGTAQALTVKAIGETSVFTGTIDEPSDLDGDGEIDQDRDVFTFDATAGQWFQLAVQSTGLPAPAFMVEGPNDYVRFSPVGLAADAARQLAIPHDGTYTVTVLPALVLQSWGDVGPSGNADWSWVGALEQLDAPTATDVDVTSTNLTGSYDVLSDNLFNLTGLSAGELVQVTVESSGANAEGVLQVWSDATQFESQYDLSADATHNISVPQSGNLLLLVDPLSLSGPDLDFDLSADIRLVEQEPNNTDATASPYSIDSMLIGDISDADEVDVFELTVPADLAADEILIVEMYSTTPGTDEYTCTIRDSAGTDVGTIDTDGDEDGCLTMSTGLLASETYYFQVERTWGSGDEPYEIASRIETGVLESEPNDSDGTAGSFDLDAVIGGNGLFGNLPMDTDTDYFSFTLAADRPAGEVVTFSAERLGFNPTPTLDWRLLDGSLTELDSASLSSDLSATGLTQGTYYIELTRSSATYYASGVYKLLASSVIPVCGNGTVEVGETCDDGNTTDGDGCTAVCELGTPTASATNNTSATIDSNTPTHTKAATVSGCTAPIWGITVDVDITHVWRGDLLLELTSPDGTTVTLHDTSGGADDDIVGNYPTTLTVDGPGALSDFSGETGNGDWQLYIEDTFPSFDDGTFNSYTVNVYCN